MRLPTFIQLLFIPVFLCFSCQEKSPAGTDDDLITVDGDWVTVHYTESTTPLVNPERGFYGGAVDIKSASNPVQVSAAKALRAKGMTLMYVGFYLTDFMNGDISQAYLDMIQTSFDALREAGIKCVLRFAYQNSESAKPWDPAEKVVLRHVNQLRPLLEENADVIFVLQAGFVGVWGEWYYTDNFIMDPRSDEDYKPRRRLTDALLRTLPDSRQIALRTPQFKMRMYGLSSKDTLTAKTAMSSYNASDLSRLGGHNDCFGASADDYGTFDNETGDRNFWKHETRYTFMGGETCKVSNYCTCPASLKDLEDYHWTYLNSGYNSSVLNRWKNTGCMEEIENRLGYRLVLSEVSYPAKREAGKKTLVRIKFANKGFAAPMNPRMAMLAFVETKGKKINGEYVTTYIPLSDPRTWLPGEHEEEIPFTLPAEHGTMYMILDDPLLQGRPEYSIALANEGVWDAKTGWNKLFDL